MFILSRLDSVPPESFQNQIRELVIHNVGELSSVAIAVDNPLYPLYQYGVGMEVHQYLQALDGARGLAVALTLALDAEAPDQLLGFACRCQPRTMRRPVHWPSWPCAQPSPPGHRPRLLDDLRRAMPASS
jgi:hypothetical protein